MHRLINRSLQCFLRDTYGAAIWAEVARDARLGFDSFEIILHYDPSLTKTVIDAAARRLDRSPEALLEDVGTYLVSHPNLEALRRLLRFGGVSFEDFLQSLEELPGRARLAIDDLDLPVLTLTEPGENSFVLTSGPSVPGLGHVIMGMLRAIADDYGALALLDHAGSGPEGEMVQIQLLEADFAEGRRFELATPVEP